MAYLTVAEFRQHRDINSGVDDSVISALIESAQAMIDNYCGRTFEASEDTTRYYDAAFPFVEGDTLYIDEVAEITTIVNGDGVTVASSEYTTRPRNKTPYFAIVLLPSSNRAWEEKSNGDYQNAIAVTGKFAYSVSAPADIKQATKQLVAWLYQQRDDPTFDVTVIPEQGVITSPQGFPAAVRHMLKPYRSLC